MNCSAAGHRIDDYLEDRLSQRDRYCLEEHLSGCARCTKELHRRSAFERHLRQTLTASVRPLRLPSASSTRIVEAAQNSFHRAVRLNDLFRALRVTAGSLAAVLLVVGLLFWLGYIPIPSQLELVTFFPASRSPLPEQHPATISSGDQPAPQSMPGSLVSLTNKDFFIEPLDLRPGEPFTMTILLRSNVSQPLDTVKLDLDISGPTGYFRFALVVKDPLPAHGTSILKVTPDLLTAPCREQYLISPTDVFGIPGMYTVRITLSSLLAKPG